MPYELIRSRISIITPEDAKQLASQFFATSKVALPFLARRSSKRCK